VRSVSLRGRLLLLASLAMVLLGLAVAGTVTYVELRSLSSAPSPRPTAGPSR
jgi:hypothetical protein